MVSVANLVLGCVCMQPNRNWDFHWGEARASTKPCSDAYQGPQAASELEVQTLQNYLYSNKDTILSYINLHSYSQVVHHILYRESFTTTDY